jgi:chromosome segregation ATPase
MSEEILETDALLAEYGKLRRELARTQAECDALRGELGQAEAATVAEREKRRKLEAENRAYADRLVQAGIDFRTVRDAALHFMDCLLCKFNRGCREGERYRAILGKEMEGDTP